MKKSRKSSSLKILNQIILGKHFKTYSVQCTKQMLPWKDILGTTKYYDNIFLCIAKSNLLSGDHIFVITRGWIFDGNLKYTIALNELNLN